jgi:hypothetical protein
MKRILLAAALMLPAALAQAQDHRAPNGAIVTPQADGSFSVYSPRSGSAQYYWCGAGDYVIRRTGAASNARIYLVEGRSRASSGRTTVTFSLTPPPGVSASGARNPLSLSVKNPGDSLSAAAAVQYCYSRHGRN